MEKVIQGMRQYPELVATIVVGILALVGTALGVSEVKLLVSVFALIMAAILSWDMVKQILGGAWGIDLLAVTAIISTVVVGEYWAALIVCLMLSGGEALEDYAARRARKQLSGLLDSVPTTAHVLDEAGNTVETAVENIEVGQRILVRPGEVVPVDGILNTDYAVTEESSLTGESLPVEHRRADQVLSGGVNGAKAMEITATALASESQYQQIIKLVEQAQASQAPVVRIADRVAVPFTLIAFVIAGVAWWYSGDPVRLAQVLVVATPCPLLLAAPVAFLAGMNRAAEEGIIIKDSGTLERLSRIRTVAMDKTGTLTQGEPVVIADDSGDLDLPEELLAWAAALENQSPHPLAKAVVQAAHERDLDIPLASEVEEISGHGVRGTVAGHQVAVGSARLTNAPGDLQTLKPGHIRVHVAVDGKWKGALELSDEVRPDAPATIATMHQLGVEDIIMITGDSLPTAQAIAAEVGINEINAELLPADKVTAIKHLTHPVAAVGDGVNDAPVLATADVGIAMGARGSTAASETADVVIMRDDIYRAARAIAIGKRTMQVALQAIGIGVGLSIVLMLVGASGIMPAVVGAFMQEIIDLACILWALLAARPGRGETPNASGQNESSPVTGTKNFAPHAKVA
ncbi:MAG: heavy metal translocating P-type ATPase [Actinomycetaceae bacterium]|nr:heavy metal translocating P-type ATPase [Actinomycetaceae bacterium]